MQTWLVPFIFIALVLALHLFSPQAARERVQARIKENMNLLLVADLILIALAIPATLIARQVWLDYVAWATLGVFSVIVLIKCLRPPAAD